MKLYSPSKHNESIVTWKFVVATVLIILALYIFLNPSILPPSLENHGSGGGGGGRSVTERPGEVSVTFSEPTGYGRNISFRYEPLVTNLNYDWSRAVCTSLLEFTVSQVSIGSARVPVVVYKCRNRILAVAVSDNGYTTVFNTYMRDNHPQLKAASRGNILIIVSTDHVYEVEIRAGEPGGFTGKLVGELDIDGLVTGVFIGPNGRYVLLNYGDAIQIYRLPLKQSEGPVLWKSFEVSERNGIRDAKIAYIDGDYIILYSDKREIHALDLNGNELWHYSESLRHRYGGLSIQPGGRLVAVREILYKLTDVIGLGLVYAPYPTLKVLDMETGRLVWEYTSNGPHVEVPPDPVWSPDGRYLAFTISGTGLIKVFTPEGAPSKTLGLGNAAIVERFAWSPDGRYISVATSCGLPLPHPVETPFYNCSESSVGAWVIDLYNKTIWRRTTAEDVRLRDSYIPMKFVWINKTLLFYSTKLEMYMINIPSGAKVLDVDYGDFASFMYAIIDAKPTLDGGIIVAGVQDDMETRVTALSPEGSLVYTRVYKEPLGVRAEVPANAISPNARYIVLTGINVTGIIPLAKISINAEVISLTDNSTLIRDVIPVGAIQDCSVAWSYDSRLVGLLCPDSSTSVELEIYDIISRSKIASLRPLPGEAATPMQAIFSPDASKIAYYSGNAIGIVSYLSETVKSFKIGELERIKDILWIDNDSIAVLTDDTLYTARVNSRDNSLVVEKHSFPWITDVIGIKSINGKLYMLLVSISNSHDTGRPTQSTGLIVLGNDKNILNIATSMDASYIRPISGQLSNDGEVVSILDECSVEQGNTKYGALVVGDYRQQRSWIFNLTEFTGNGVYDILNGRIYMSKGDSIFVVTHESVVKVSIKRGVYHASVNFQNYSIIKINSIPGLLSVVNGSSLVVYKEVNNTHYSYLWGIKLYQSDKVVFDPEKNRIIVGREVANDTVGREVEVDAVAFFDYNGSLINTVEHVVHNPMLGLSLHGNYLYSCRLVDGVQVVALDYNGRTVLRSKIRINETGFTGFNLPACRMSLDEKYIGALVEMYGNDNYGNEISRHLLLITSIKNNQTRKIELPQPSKGFVYSDVIFLDNKTLALLSENLQEHRVTIRFYSIKENGDAVQLNETSVNGTYIAVTPFTSKGKVLILVENYTYHHIELNFIGNSGGVECRAIIKRPLGPRLFSSQTPNYLALASNDGLAIVNLEKCTTEKWTVNIGKPLAAAIKTGNSKNIYIASSQGIYIFNIKN